MDGLIVLTLGWTRLYMVRIARSSMMVSHKYPVFLQRCTDAILG